MPIKGSGGGDLTAIDRFEIDDETGGVGWLTYPDEAMQRASHALEVGGRLWLVDPIDAEGLDDFLAEAGEVDGVTVLLDRHKRDAAAMARRHDVSVHLPEALSPIAGDLDCETTTFERELGETGYVAHEVVTNRFWREVALFHQETGVLVVPEAVGTTSYFTAGDERLGVHVGLRLTPPRSLAALQPEHVLVGHGAGVHEGAATALRDAVRGSRRRAPRLYAGNLRAMLPF